MFGSIGGPEILMIFLLGLLLLGPKRLPEMGRMFGKAMVEFRRATSELRAGIEKEVDLTPVRDARRAVDAARRELGNLARAPMRAIEREVREAESLTGAPATDTAAAGDPAEPGTTRGEGERPEDGVGASSEIPAAGRDPARVDTDQSGLSGSGEA